MWWSYQDVAEAKARIQREIDKRRKRGERFEALQAPAGRKSLCATFWGQAWCRNLESYQQYESRLPRGRSYLRQGNVYNLRIENGKLEAVVAGSELYDTVIHIHPLNPAQWKETVKSCEGRVGSMLDLLSGKLGDGVMEVLGDAKHGLFPKPREIRFDCSCPDYADMCKHVSAVLYGVGVLLDTQPELLFTLRGVDGADLLSQAKDAAVAGVAENSAGELTGADLSSLFGIDLGGELPIEPKADLQETSVPTGITGNAPVVKKACAGAGKSQAIRSGLKPSAKKAKKRKSTPKVKAQKKKKARSSS